MTPEMRQQLESLKKTLYKNAPLDDRIVADAYEALLEDLLSNPEAHPPEEQHMEMFMNEVDFMSSGENFRSYGKRTAFLRMFANFVQAHASNETSKRILTQLHTAENLWRAKYKMVHKKDAHAVLAVEPLSPLVTHESKNILLRRGYLEDTKSYTKSDILRFIRFLENDKQVAPAQRKHTIAFLRQIDYFPEYTTFKVVTNKQYIVLLPDHALSKVSTIKQHVDTQICVVGGELESVVTAIEAAKNNKHVALLYDCPLGGLSSDTGGNMRFFDYIKTLDLPVLNEVLHEALGMDPNNVTSLPEGVSDKLYSYLQEKYPQIELYRVSSLRDVRVQKQDNKLESLIVDGKWKIRAEQFLDMNPNASIAEKIGMKMSIETPHLAFGIIVDLQGITKNDFIALSRSPLLDPDQLLQTVGLRKADIQQNKTLMELYTTLKNVDIDKDAKGASPYYTYGFKKLGYGYDFYMRIKELQSPDPLLHMLNYDRLPDSFNVAVNGNTLTLNSLSYRSFQGRKTTIAQHYHNLYEDPQFSLIRQIEKPHFEGFIQMLAASVNVNNAIILRLPPELYVRKSDFTIKPLDKMPSNEKSDEHAEYPIDTRKAVAYDKYDHLLPKIAQLQEKLTGERRKWYVNAKDAQTSLSNVFSIGKNSVHALYSGRERIIPVQIAMGKEVIRKIIEK